MQTYSHFLLTAVLQNRLQQQGTNREKRSLLLGSVAPDVPLTLISIGYVLDRRFIRPQLPDKTRCSPTYNDLYFNNPWWIAAHNMLHAPLPIMALGLLGYLARRRRWGFRLFWFAVGCGLHSAVDFATHVDDGPLLFFPLDWHKRASAPISYWDNQHGGRVFRFLEHLLDIVLVINLILKGGHGGAITKE